MTTRYVPLMVKDKPDVQTYPLGSWSSLDHAIEATRQTMEAYGRIHGDIAVTEHDGKSRNCERRLNMSQHGWQARIYAIDAHTEGDMI